MKIIKNKLKTKSLAILSIAFLFLFSTSTFASTNPQTTTLPPAPLHPNSPHKHHQPKESLHPLSPHKRIRPQTYKHAHQVSQSSAQQPAAIPAEITSQIAQNMLQVAQQKTKIPLSVNPMVMAKLQKILGTKYGRKNLAASLKNSQKYKLIVKNALKHEKIPEELSAIPMVESSYRNISLHTKPFPSGIWMFLPKTALGLGLKVNYKNDERLHVRKETTAAAKLLSQLYERYHDWNLAIMAYNCGDKNVDRYMKKMNTNDAWTILSRLPKGRHTNEMKSYLPSVIATILIEKNMPEILG